MKYERSESFKGDYNRLADHEKQMFRDAARSFSEACDRVAQTKNARDFPKRLRVGEIKGAPGIFEMTWSFVGPDGRATWEWIEVEVVDPATNETVRQRAVRWRRVGNHAIFKKP